MIVTNQAEFDVAMELAELGLVDQISVAEGAVVRAGAELYAEVLVHPDAEVWIGENLASEHWEDGGLNTPEEWDEILSEREWTIL